MPMRLGSILVFCSLAASPALAADRIIGAATPDGGALLVKHFAVPAGATVAGVTFVSNDLRTVFPKLTLLRGPISTMSAGERLVEFTHVRASGSHHITLRFSPFHLDSATDLYVAVTMPPSDGVVEYGVGAGIPATQLDAPAGCYFASGIDAAMGPMDVDYDIELVLNQESMVKPGALDSEGEEARPITFLRAGAPNPSSGVTAVSFGLEKSGMAELSVYDVAGRQVRVLAHETLSAGTHVREWGGRDGQGRQAAAGIYLIRLTVPERVLTQKLVLTK